MKQKTYMYSIFLLFFIAIFIQSIYNLTIIINTKSKNLNSLIYSNKSNVSYNVEIKENDFIGDKIITENNSYITELIDKINFNMQYTFETTEKLNLKYSNQLIATLVGIYNENPTSDNNPTIWEKDYVLVPLQEEEINDSKFTIEKTFSVKLDEYNIEASKFLAKFEIPTITYLEIRMPIDISGNNDKYVVDQNYKVLARIPLLTKVTKVETELQRNEEKSIDSYVNNTEKIDQRRATIYVLMLGASLLLIAATIKRLPFFYSDESYKEYIKDLKKEFDEIIVETNNMIDFKDLKPIMITSFKEMVNLAQSLETPIILFEKEYFASFYIVNANIIYMFLLKDDKKELKDLMKK